MLTYPLTVADLKHSIPSFIIILIVAKFFEKFKKSKTVSGCMSGLKPAVIGLISSAVISLGATAFIPVGLSIGQIFSSITFYVSVFIFAVMMTASLKKLSPILVIIGSAFMGILAGYIFNIQL